MICKTSLISLILLISFVYSNPISLFKNVPFHEGDSTAHRDSVEIVIGGEDIANAAKFVRKKVPEKVDDWKESFKKKIVDKLTNDDIYSSQERQMVVNSDMLQLLDNGNFKIIKQDGSQDLMNNNGKNKERTKNIKSNAKDLGVKDFHYQKSDMNQAESDPFDS